jgi:hypothetical protein
MVASALRVSKPSVVCANKSMLEPPRMGSEVIGSAVAANADLPRAPAGGNRPPKVGSLS